MFHLKLRQNNKTNFPLQAMDLNGDGEVGKYFGTDLKNGKDGKSWNIWPNFGKVWTAVVVLEGFFDFEQVLAESAQLKSNSSLTPMRLVPNMYWVNIQFFSSSIFPKHSKCILCFVNPVCVW